MNKSKIISIQELMKGRNAEFDNSTKIRVMRLSEKYAKKDFIGSQNDSIRSLCKFAKFCASLHFGFLYVLTQLLNQLCLQAPSSLIA